MFSFRLCIFLSVAVMSVWSCDYRDLYTISGDTCDICIDVDWDKFSYKEEPTGMSVYCYPRGGSKGPYIYKTNNISKVIVSLPVGTYDIMVFNQSVDEFGSMHFEGMDSYSTATAVLDEITTKWKVNVTGDESVKYEPEWLGVGTREEVEVTEEMVEKFWKVRPWVHGSGSQSVGESQNTVSVVTVVPENLVYTAYVNIRVYGVNNMSEGRGSISGMAEGVNMTTGRKTYSAATHVLESWNIDKDENDYTKGYVWTTYRCFGIPENMTAKSLKYGISPESSIFNYTFLLQDGKTMDYSYSVGNLIECRDDVKEIYLSLGPITLPDVKSGNEGGFDAELEDWSEEEIIDIPV